MLRRLVARTLRPFKRAVLWLTGERERRAQIDQIAIRLDAQIAQIAVRLDRMDASLGLLTSDQRQTDNATLLSGLHVKVDRLHADLYQLHEKVDHLHTRIASLPESSTAITRAMVSGEIDRLDGYLVYHTEQLHSHTKQLQSALQALDRQSLRLAEEAAEGLTGEFDRLDGSILHHFAVLRAQLGTGSISSREDSTPVRPARDSNDG